ncbi:MAG: hypothetical protein ACP5NZ_04985 [Nanobdellota archaeon]
MKKVYLYGFVFLLALSLVLAAGEGSLTAGSNQEDNSLGDSGNLESGQSDDSGSENASGSEEPQLYTAQVNTQTMNQGEESQLRVQTNTQAGTTLQSGNSEAKTSMKMSQGEDGKAYAELSNGMNAEIKVMPDTASQRALEVLGAKCEETGCKIELKEVGKGEETKAAYEVQAKKQVKVLGLFKSQMNTQAQVNAETGEVIKTRNAWWGFLASKKSSE